MSLSTPVVFVIYKRPDLTKRVFEAIAKAKPQKLLVVADGPGSPEEVEKCQEARAVVEKVDWNCDVLTNFSETNMGCRRRVSTGLDWVFSEVEEAIILEDDTLPAPSFFYFCQTLLEHYQHDERITYISGNNFQSGQSRTDYSYYFSRYGHMWGWASWGKTWNSYDVDMKTWPEFKKTKMIEFVCEDPYEQRYWTNIFDRTFEGAIDTWDYQWLYASWSQNRLSIMPNLNLVSNIGFRLDGTHTFDKSPLAEFPTGDIWEIKHPPFVLQDRAADAYTFEYVLGGKRMRERNTLKAWMCQGLSKMKWKVKRSFVNSLKGNK